MLRICSYRQPYNLGNKYDVNESALTTIAQRCWVRVGVDYTSSWHGLAWSFVLLSRARFLAFFVIIVWVFHDAFDLFYELRYLRVCKAS